MMQRILKSKIFILLILMGICIPVVLPYFSSGYFPTHDGEWAVVRLADMFRSLRDLQFPVRYSGALNFGYGYPLFNFAYPFPYYLGVALYFPTHSFIISIKSIFVLSVFLSSIFMYLASLQLWKSRIGAFSSSVIYIYLPYRMVDLYVRGSIGESLAFALFPVIFYFALKLFDSPFDRIIVVLLSLTIGMLVMTHNIMILLFMPLLLSFILIRIIVEKRFDVMQSLILCLLLGSGISFFFWFPALFEKGNILLSQIPIADRNLYFVNLSKLVIPSWGYAPPTESGGFTYQLGLGQIGIVIVTLIVLCLTFIKNKFLQTPIVFYSSILFILYLLYLAMMFSFTGFIWNFLPLLSEINYPWTILAILGFITSLLASFLVVRGTGLKYIVIVLVCLCIFVTLPYAKPSSTMIYPDSYYLTNEATTTSSSELTPLWVKEKPTKRYDQKVEVITGSAVVSELKYNSKSISFTYKSNDDSVLQVNTIYYPGWKAYLNGDLTKIDYDNEKGVMRINASKFRNKVSFYFTETFPRLGANIVSIVSILVLLFILLRPLLLFRSYK